MSVMPSGTCDKNKDSSHIPYIEHNNNITYMSNTKENMNITEPLKKPVRFKNHTIESTPTEKFQELVTVTKGAKKWDIIGRQYISEEKARLAIEKVYSDSLIESGEIKAKKVVINLGLGKEGDSV